MSDDSKPPEQNTKVPAGRFTRLAKLASLTARTASDLALGRAKKALGDEGAVQAGTEDIAKRMLETLGTMKGAAMKLGQQLAMEADTLSPEAQAIVARLYAQAPRMSWSDVVSVITEELGDPPEQVFAEIDRTAIASASLGQVHKARLKDGTQVAVKVQYPGVAEALINDLKNAGLFVSAFNGASRAMSSFDAKPYYEEIRREIGAETDYIREAKQGAEFAAAVADVPELHVPRVHAAYSTGRVLTMDFVEGIPLHVFGKSDAGPEERWRVSKQLVTAILYPFLNYGFIHGDPHPGNFLVRKDGRLTVLDFGAVKKLSPQFVSAFRELLSSAVEDRTPDLIPVLSSAGFTFKGDPQEATRHALDLHWIAARPLMVEEYDWGTCQIVQDVRKKFTTDFRGIVDVQAPPECILFYRAIGGIANNLRMLRSRGPYRAHARELLREAVPVAA